MQITDLKKIGKGKRYSLTVDQVFQGVFESEALAKYNLKTGQEIDEDFLKSLKLENGDFACFDRALNLLEHGWKTQKQVKDFLRGKCYPEESILKAMQKLEDYGYLDDQVFANEYVKLYGQKDGEKKIRFALKSKGVDDEKTNLAIQNYLDEDLQKQSCLSLAQKKSKNLSLDAKGKQKLYSFLAGRGFNFETIKWAVSKLEEEL